MEKDFCEYCKAILPENGKLITVYRHRRGQHFIFERVPARVCPRCGERYFSAPAVREMDSLMSLPILVSVPVIEVQPA
jgi:YgiT-type zinc finger domain-containing protein